MGETAPLRNHHWRVGERLSIPLPEGKNLFPKVTLGLSHTRRHRLRVTGPHPKSKTEGVQLDQKAWDNHEAGTGFSIPQLFMTFL